MCGRLEGECRALCLKVLDPLVQIVFGNKLWQQKERKRLSFQRPVLLTSTGTVTVSRSHTDLV